MNKHTMVASKLILIDVENLQEKVNTMMKVLEGSVGVYVSLNKTQKSLEEIFIKNEVDTTKVFFIDCVTTEKTREDVLHIPPRDLTKLSNSIDSFMEEIHGEKFLLIDALSTLLIYNSENDVAAFIKKITEDATAKKMRVIALSPKSRGEELLNKIFNFFDEVEQ